MTLIGPHFGMADFRTSVTIKGKDHPIPRVYRIAAIDLGSNAVRMAVAEAYSPYFFVPLKGTRKPLRLGESVFTDGKITYGKMRQAVKYFRRFRDTLDKYKVDYHFAVGTSALRDAKNGQELIELIKNDSNITLNVIDGKVEADLIYKAITNNVDFEDKNTLLLDIGGGSIELTYIEHGKRLASTSLQIGTVRTLEQMKKAGIREWEVDEYMKQHRDQVRKFLDKKSHGKGIQMMVGTGGNIERFAKLRSYFKQTREDNFLDLKSLEHIRMTLSALTMEERMHHFRLKPDRADVIIPAGAILSMVMTEAGCKSMHVPKVGLRDGVLYQMSENLAQDFAPGHPLQK